MQRAILKRDIDTVVEYVEREVRDYINENQTETFESHGDYDIVAFDWYDITAPGSDPAQMMIYIDRDDLIILCENDAALEKARLVLHPAATNERCLYEFFTRLLRDDMTFLEAFERRISDTEARLMTSAAKDCLTEIIACRNELLDLKRYYQQLATLFESLNENENLLITDEALRLFTILGSRAERFLARTSSLRDYVSQVREAYQAQIDIEQNKLMKVFTVITAVFLPLTLLVGWYGMNFRYMPELAWKYSYPVFGAACAAIVVILLVVFKKHRWL